jgi:hypothetical protein
LEGDLTGRARMALTARTMALLAMLAVALVCVACGDDGSDAPEGPVAILPEPDAESLVALAVREVQETLQDGKDSLAVGDLRVLCARMSKVAQFQAGSMAHGSPSECEADVRKALGMIRKGGGFEHARGVRVVGVDLAGDRATATVARDVRRTTDLPFVVEGGRWRLDSFFGTPPQRAGQLAHSIERSEFPLPQGSPVRAVDGRRGHPCPSLDQATYPRIRGGCVFTATTEAVAPITIATAFGDFEFADCSMEYRVRVDRAGRTWTDAFRFQDDTPEITGCSDVYRCPLDEPAGKLGIAKALAPLRGRIESDGQGGFVHRMSVCLKTCVGFYAGDLVVQMTREGNHWRAEAPDAQIGGSGFTIHAPFKISSRDGLDLRAMPADPLRDLAPGA